MAEKEHSNLGVSLISSIGQSDLSDVATEAGEIVLDSLLEDGVLKDIPIFGWLFKAYKARQSISDRLFLRKVAAFLYGVGEAPAEKREEFREKVAEDIKYQRKVGENLLLLIDRHERIEKSLLLGRLFASHVRGDLTHELFLRLAAALDKAVIEDLEELKKSRIYGRDSADVFVHGMSKHVNEGLYRCGFVDIEVEISTRELDRQLKRDSPGVPTEIDYRLSDLGKLFIEHAFQRSSESELKIDSPFSVG